MEFEDSRFALFPEPNAYIQKVNNECGNKEIKKIVFQEPYETLPNFYMNNNFTKHNCECVSNKQNHNNKSSQCNHDCNCNHESSNLNNKHCNNDGCRHDGCSKGNGFGFDLKNLMPLIGMFNKSGGVDLSGFAGLLSKNNLSNEGNSNPINLISSILSNKETMGGLLNLFKGGGLNLFKKNQLVKKQIKTTDFEIKNYTRVK